ncbi:hypothetical protein [Vibrio bivalvicida]|uniref:Uncharacterized protein n=1 Tax=Vibrio bivalvicida TaxID=1276888 RepID=A0ABV4MJ46_9VIBR
MKFISAFILFVMAAASALAKYSEDDQFWKKHALVKSGVDNDRVALVAERLSHILPDDREQLESELEYLEQFGEELTLQQSARWCDIYLYLQGESSLNPISRTEQRSLTIDELIDEANQLSELLEQEGYSKAMLNRYQDLSTKLDFFNKRFNQPF